MKTSSNLMSKAKNCLIIVVLLTCFLLNGCQKSPSGVDRIFFDFMGTSVYVVLYEDNSFFWQKNRNNECFNLIEERLAEISSTFSVEDENSIVSKFNKKSYGESVEINSDFEQVFEIATQVYNQTNGYYNPSVKKLVDLWGFSKRHSQAEYVKTFDYDRDRNQDGSFALPSQEYIDAFVNLCDFENIKIEDSKIIKNCQPQTVNNVIYQQEIDLSGIVKGYACDEINEIIDSFSIKKFYLSVGSSSMYLAKNADNQAFQLGITNPNDIKTDIAKISISDTSISTSGTYQNFYKIDGRTYHHIINCKTGKPAEVEISSLTISGINGAWSDALSTALIAMGDDGAIEFLNSHAEINYIAIKNSSVSSRGFGLIE